MENRLPVRTDQRDALWGNAKLLAIGERRVGKCFSQTKIQLAEIASADGMLLRDAKNLFA